MGLALVSVLSAIVTTYLWISILRIITLLKSMNPCRIVDAGSINVSAPHACTAGRMGLGHV